MSNHKPLCHAPFSRVFTITTQYRVCCVTNEQIFSSPDSSFESWWHSTTMENFREKMFQDKLPKECENCSRSEEIHGSSFRTELNKIPINGTTPNAWNILFGNTCNLACWTCNEMASSTILQHKKKLNILPENFIDPDAKFLERWPDLENNILKSYESNDTVVLTVLGGEPVYNKTVLNFLEKLVTLNLSQRTRLEITTNGTKLNKNILQLLNKNNWNYVCVFVSIDAVGEKAEWLRYGSNWNEVEKNVLHYQQCCDYIEIHTTLSMLNINDIIAVNQYAKNINIKQIITPIYYPDFMSLDNWDKPVDFLCRANFEQVGLENYFDMIGRTARPGSQDMIKQYIKQFNSIRKPLYMFDPVLAQVLDL